MKQLTVNILQYDIVWENPEANFVKIETLLQGTSNTNIILLPEMFATGFTMDSKKLSEKMDGKTVQWMVNLACKFNSAVGGSIIINENNSFFNRFVWVTPDNEITFYDKRHLFRMGNEQDHYAQGKNKVIIDYLGWKICPLICYDLRFPVWSRNTEGYDLLIYVANWPEARAEVWNTLLKARAIENQCYCAGVNRIGTDGMNLKYSGNSALIDPKGILLTETIVNLEKRIQCTLEKEELNSFREKFPVALDADNFEIKNI